MITINVPLTQNQFTIIDEIDFHLIKGKKWCCHFRGRSGVKQPVAISRKGNIVLFLHRMIMSAPEGMVVDHINGNSLDNRRSNLRLCTQKQNAMNIHKKKWKGVALRNAKKGLKSYYQSYLKSDGKFISLGCYPTKLLAAQAYNKGALRYFGEFACLNDLSLVV